MKQMSLFKEKNIGEFGGDLFKNQRRRRRPLDHQRPVHVVLKSQVVLKTGGFAQFQKIIAQCLSKYAPHFNVTVYEFAICSNHLHMVVKSRTTNDFKNFLRTLAGQVAYRIKKEVGIKGKREEPFWLDRPYTKVIHWGQQLDRTLNYVEKNQLESKGWIEYAART